MARGGEIKGREGKGREEKKRCNVEEKQNEKMKIFSEHKR